MATKRQAVQVAVFSGKSHTGNWTTTKPLTPIQTERAEKQKAKEKAAKKKAGMKAARDRQKEQAAAEAERRLADPMSYCAMPPEDANGRTMPPFPANAMRLGFPVKVMGAPNLKSNDTRRWQQNPHLRVSLGYLCDIFAYLRKHDIRMYRMSSELAPYHTHPDMPQFHNMVEESRDDLGLHRQARPRPGAPA